jgi:hypothetical protein
VTRLRTAPKAPLAVAGILATPLFFVGLMAFALLLDKPSVDVARNGGEILGDPTRGIVATIYLAAFAVSGGVVLVGVAALLLPSRVALIFPAVSAIVATTLLLLPLDSWEADHTARYPNGVDLIAKRDPSDLILRGEWEENARTAANQIGLWTIVIAVVAIILHLALDARRRRGVVAPPAPPPPEISHPI